MVPFMFFFSFEIAQGLSDPFSDPLVTAKYIFTIFCTISKKIICSLSACLSQRFLLFCVHVKLFVCSFACLFVLLVSMLLKGAWFLFLWVITFSVQKYVCMRGRTPTQHSAYYKCNIHKPVSFFKKLCPMSDNKTFNSFGGKLASTLFFIYMTYHMICIVIWLIIWLDGNKVYGVQRSSLIYKHGCILITCHS